MLLKLQTFFPYTLHIKHSITYRIQFIFDPHLIWRTHTITHSHSTWGKEREIFIKIYRVSMYVCISDWGQSVIRDEMRFYGWWNVSQNTHRKARMRNNFHWYVNNSLLAFSFSYFSVSILSTLCCTWEEMAEVLPFFHLCFVCMCVFDKHRMWYCSDDNLSIFFHRNPNISYQNMEKFIDSKDSS